MVIISTRGPLGTNLGILRIPELRHEQVSTASSEDEETHKEGHRSFCNIEDTWLRL